MLFWEDPLQKKNKTPISPVSPTGQAVEWHGVNREREGSARVRLVTPGSPVTHHRPARLGESSICGHFQTKSTWKDSFFLTYNFLNHTYFFIEFCIGYIKGSICISPKANNQCRCHFPRSLNCPLYRVANLGRAYRFFSSSFDNLVRRRVRQIAYLLTSVVTASMRRCRQ